MNPTEIKNWLDDNFEDHEEYLVEIKANDGTNKRFLVSAEVPQQIGGAVYEFTTRGGEVLSYEEIDLAGEDAEMSLDLDGLIVSEHLLGQGNEVDLPLLLDLPNPEKTSVEKIAKRFEDYAYGEGLKSFVEQFGSDSQPEEIDEELLSAAMKSYQMGLNAQDTEYMPHMTMEAWSNLNMVEHITDRMEKNGGGDAYDEFYYSDDNPLRGFSERADEVLRDLGIETDLESDLRNSFMEGCMEQDDSQALDWLDQEVTINFHPSVDHNGSVDDGMITCDSVSGDAYRVVPDEQFRDTLAFLNVSGQEYEDIIKEMSGGNFILSRDNDEWAKIIKDEGSLDAWCPKSDPSKEPLVTGPNLVELIENTNGYGVLCWSINVNLKDLLSTPPGEKITLSGGQIGFHDYLNGSGHMEDYAVRDQEVQLDQIHFVPDQLMRYGVDSVYGMTKHAMDGDFKWKESDKKRYLEEKKSLFVEYMRSEGLPQTKEGISLDEDGNSYFVMNGGSHRTLVDIYKVSEKMYGSKPDLDHLLSDKDRDELGIKSNSQELKMG